MNVVILKGKPHGGFSEKQMELFSKSCTQQGGGVTPGAGFQFQIWKTLKHPVFENWKTPKHFHEDFSFCFYKTISSKMFLQFSFCVTCKTKRPPIKKIIK